ncbi:LLM class flavin-dependent oxidoreductase [Kitasatospora kifunensis]|uniref:Alkanesulfonate monooxygenase SsuD/methylene tetrahydromethanopterin reductase-like flavin-dependent oxidoreductase (Luciferase family) n=1 Tax=Kitasatospora kifunensis TaxID=58351 RepID=A0A7W7R2Q2_KITKI|nr:LLM class flavin-dependent oxidoreductase [Kitasatospora kifunensis]MBB4924325.1 alkanesulfonate monooxygenase SsuD/methylene tetrahydromethanopterin reductase-like flavin-dependent oxidoreductase (luciferase family) [Kitasatospora kifunensis]
MRLSTVILPIHRWNEGQKIWHRAEGLGFHAAYTYDHLSWRSFRDEPWFGAVPTLTAAATATERIRLGTLVTSPNFRHPVTLAKELLTVDDISGGRLTVGIGAGGVGFDATAMGQEAWSPKERADRFGEFLPLLDELLTQDATTSEGRYYSAVEARNIPGCVQRPRVPFYVAATGPRGLRLAAEYGQGWVTYGDPRGPAEVPVEQAPAVIEAQLAKLRAACEAQGRDVDELEKVLLQGSTAERPLASLDAFVDWAGRYQELGITELVIHWPVPDSIFESDFAVFERIATEGLNQLG